MLRVRLRESAGAFATNTRNPLLLRAQLAFGAAFAAEWAFTVGLTVVAYTDGGVAAVGIVALVRMVPAALVNPVASALADRMRRDHVLLATSVIRAGATGISAVVLAAGGPVAAVYVLAIVATTAFTAFRPAHSALLPSLCRSPAELTAANVVRGLLDSLSILLGPALAAVLLATGSPAAVFAAAGLLAAVPAALLVRFHYEPPPRAAAPPLRGLPGEVVAGARVVWADVDIRLIVGMGCVQTFTRGALSVFLVVIAVELLGAGDAAVGTLTAALGAGAVLGSFVAASLGRGALAAMFGVGLALWGLPLIGIAAVPEWAPALALLALIGAGNALLDVGGFTLLARLSPEQAVARVFGLFEAVLTLAVGLGAIVAPVLLELAGNRGGIVLVGLLAPLVTLLAWRRLRRLDADVAGRDVAIDVLRRVPLFRVLPMAAIEQLGGGARPLTVPAGETVFEQGDAGDAFYVIVRGQAEVIGDGRPVRTMDAGDGFGEIALLRATPRTATVRALGDLELLGVDRAAFLPAVTGYRSAGAEAEAIADRRLSDFAPAER